MVYWLYIFWVSIIIFFYNYVGYAIITLIINKLTVNHTKKSTVFFPSVSFIVAAYNEESIIEQKIKNSFEQDYPTHKIEYIFITDGSTDKTPDIISKYNNIKLLHQQQRKGKSNALNRAVNEAANEILIISDANTVLNKDAVKNIAAHYSDEKVGGVAGEKKVFSGDEKEDVGAGEGLYWKYESFLKKLDSEFYSVVGAAGELFSLRRKLYEPIPERIILDDFVISLNTAKKGYRIIYEPDAYAMETASVSYADERKRKVRIAAGGFQAIQYLYSLFFFWRHFRLSFLYISHRVLRWTLSPLCLILILISNVFLAAENTFIFYKVVLVLQLLFYVIAVLSAFISSNSKLKFFKFTGYFVFMNTSVIQGFFRFIQKKQSVIWEKANRAKGIINSK